MNRNSVPTDYKFRKALQALAGTSITSGSSTNLNSALCAPGSGKASTGQPDHIAQIPIGIKYGYINRINLNSDSEYKYEVIFPDTNTSVWAKRYGRSGETNTPAGKVINGLLFPSERVNVGAAIEWQSFSWVIVVEEEATINTTPGTKTITLGDSTILLSKDSIKLECGESNITITNNEINITASSVKINGEGT